MSALDLQDCSKLTPEGLSAEIGALFLNCDPEKSGKNAKNECFLINFIG